MNPGSSRTGYISSVPPPLLRDSPPPLQPEPTDVTMDEDTTNPPIYVSSDNGWGEPQPTWDDDSAFRAMDVEWGGGGSSTKVDIDGRDVDEEEKWWDPELRERRKRPGPGILPPLLADLLHNPEHTLYSVTVSPPGSKHQHSNSVSSISSQSSASRSDSPSSHAPSADEVRMAVPHPNAYYCKEHNGWVLISWCSSSVLPPLARSFSSTTAYFPDQTRRKRTQSCVGDGEQPFGQANKTHHFHRYERAVDARMLTIPYKRSDWEEEDLRKRQRRKMTLHEEGENTPENAEKREADTEGDLLDLYVCCQCSVYCLSSQVIPGVIPAKYMEEVTKEKLAHPALDKTAHATVMAAWETFTAYVLPHLYLCLFIASNASNLPSSYYGMSTV